MRVETVILTALTRAGKHWLRCPSLGYPVQITSHAPGTAGPNRDRRPEVTLVVKFVLYLLTLLHRLGPVWHLPAAKSRSVSRFGFFRIIVRRKLPSSWEHVWALAMIRGSRCPVVVRSIHARSPWPRKQMMEGLLPDLFSTYAARITSTGLPLLRPGRARLDCSVSILPSPLRP